MSATPDKIVLVISPRGITTTLLSEAGQVLATDSVDVLPGAAEFETRVGVQKDPAPKPVWLQQPLRELRTGAINAFMALHQHGGNPHG